MSGGDGFTADRPLGPGLYRARTLDGSWDEFVRLEPGPRGLVCVPDDRAVAPVLLSRVPPGSLLWRREP